MTLGVRVHDYGRGGAGELFSAIGADGWQTVQLACKKALVDCASVADCTPDYVAGIGRALQNAGLTVAVLGAYVELSMVEEAERKRHADEFRAWMPVAKALNAGCIGSETTNMNKQGGATRKEALASLRRSLGEILPEAERLGVTVALEPVVYHAMNTPEETRQVLRDLASDNLKVIYDPVNLLDLDGIAQQHLLWERAMDCFGEEIVAVHAKGIAVKDGALVSVGLADSLVDWEYVFSLLRKLHRDLPVLREEAVPERAAEDQAFLGALIQ